MAKSIKELIIGEVLKTLQDRVEQYKKLKKQYQHLRTQLDNHKYQYDKQIQSLQINDTIKTKFLQEWQFLRSRVSLQNQKQPCNKINLQIDRLEKVIKKFETFSARIEYRHLAAFKELNNVYFELKDESNNNQIHKHRKYIEQYSRDIETIAKLKSTMKELNKTIQLVVENEQSQRNQLLRKLDSCLEEFI